MSLLGSGSELDFKDYRKRENTSESHPKKGNSFEAFADKVEILMAKEKFADAIKQLNKEKDVFGQNFYFYYLSGECYLNLNLIGSAIKSLKYAIGLRDETQIKLLLAYAHFRNDDFEESLNEYLDALEHYKLAAHEEFEVYKNIGNIYLKLGNFELAEECYMRALDFKPDSDIVYVNLGVLNIQKCSFNEALNYLRTAIDYNPQNGKAWIGLALVHREFGDFDLSWSNLKASLDVDSNDQLAQGLVLEWALQDGKEREAIVLFSQLYEKTKQNLELLQNIALLQIKIGQSRYALEAINVLEQKGFKEEKLQNLRQKLGIEYR